MTPPPGAEWRVAPRGLTHALCERPPLQGQAVGDATGSHQRVIEALHWEDTRGVAGEPLWAVFIAKQALTSAKGVTGTSVAALCARRGQKAGVGGSSPCWRWGSASPSFRFVSSHASSSAVLAWCPSEAV